MNINQLPEINPEEFSELYCMLNQITIPLKNSTNSRRQFGKHRSTTFGFIRGRFNGKYQLSQPSIKYPSIYKELKRIGDLICPFAYTSIHLNNNVICPKHKDCNNVGDSLLVSFGDYSGCNIVVDGTEYDTNCKPIVFNGTLLEHYNTNDLIGNKYSLIYYNAHNNTFLQ